MRIKCAASFAKRVAYPACPAGDPGQYAVRLGGGGEAHYCGKRLQRENKGFGQDRTGERGKSGQRTQEVGKRAGQRLREFCTEERRRSLVGEERRTSQNCIFVTNFETRATTASQCVSTPLKDQAALGLGNISLHFLRFHKLIWSSSIVAIALA